MNNIFINIIGFFPIILPIISYIIGNPTLSLILLADLFVINPLIKKILGLLGLQTYRPLEKCQNNDGFTDISKCYGMPSGHTEIHIIFLLYLLLNNNIPLFIIVLIMTLLTIWQRLITNNHTIKQIIGGVITGTILYFYII